MYTSYLSRSPTIALNSPASLADGIKEVRSPGRTKEGKGVGWYIQQDV